MRFVGFLAIFGTVLGLLKLLILVTVLSNSSLRIYIHCCHVQLFWGKMTINILKGEAQRFTSGGVGSYYRTRARLGDYYGTTSSTCGNDYWNCIRNFALEGPRYLLH